MKTKGPNQGIKLMKINELTTPAEESTYSLLVRSEEKTRDYFETIVYALVIFCAIAAILQFTLQPDSLPLTAIPAQSQVG
jgi:hypothetical protein